MNVGGFMKKKFFAISAVIFILVMSLTACNNVEFKITFEVDGQNYYEINTKGEEVIAMPDNPAKDDYIFEGWYWDKDVWQKPFTAESLLSEKLKSDMTVYARWIEVALTEKVFDVTFNSMGGSEVASQEIKYGMLVQRPNNPTKDGKLFSGWYKNPDYKSEWSFESDTVMGDIEIYAKWVDDIPENRLYTVSFNSNGGSPVNDVTGIKYNAKIEKPFTPTRDGYALVGWYTDNTFAEEWNFSLDTVKENLTLYARWEKADVTACELVSADGFDVDNDNMYIKTPNDQTTFNFLNKIKVSPFANWTIVNDLQGKDEVPSGNVEIAVGDNVKYLLVTSYDGLHKKFYTITIRRRPIYNVTIIPENGEENLVFNVEEDQLIVAPELKREGYTVSGYIKDIIDETEIMWDVTKDTVTADTNLTVKWTSNAYTATFNSNGGNEIAAQNVVFNESYEFPVPEKRGYNFVKWAFVKSQVVEGEEEPQETVVDLTNEFGVGLSVWNEPADVTAFAVYNAISYNIEYESVRNVTNANVTSYTIEDEVIFLPLAKDGYIFNGWLDENNEIIEKIEKGSINDRTIKADWDAIDYTATFKADGEEIIIRHFNMDDETIDMPSIPEKVGYTAEWESFAIVPRNIEVNAIYTPIVYTLTYVNVIGNFDTDIPVNKNQTTYTIESEIIVLKEASKAGYKFVNWTDENDETVTEIAEGSIGNRILKANWNKISYSLTFVLENEDGEYEGHYIEGIENRETFTVEDEFSFVEPVCDIKGYEFKGWYTTKNETGEKVTGISYKTIGNKKFYAQWQRVDYTITYYNMEKASNDNPIAYNIDTDTFTLNVPTRVGYDFKGWFVNEELTESANATVFKGSIGNLAFYAKWQLHVYDITYILYDGINDINNPLTYTYDDEITLAEATKTRYSFGGWYDNAEFVNRVEKIAKGTSGNLTLYAKWYYVGTVTFITNGGSVIDPITREFGTALKRPTNPTKDYYIFENWYEDETLTKVYEFTTMPDKDFNLYAKWIPIEYTITYVLNNGKNGANPAKYTADDEIVFADASRVGYTFKGWFTDASLTSTVVEKFEKGSHGDVTLYAGFDINKYTLTFDSVGGTGVTAITQDYDTVVTAPEVPSKIGYAFVGWYKDAQYKNEYVFARMQAEDLTLFAKWKLENYLIDYNLSGGTNNAQNPKTYTIEDNTIVLKKPTKVGYEFIAWYKENTFETVVTEIPSGSNGIISLHAKWEIINYNISYVGVDGLDNNNPTTYTVEDSIVFVEIAKKGYTFDGLFTSKDYAEAISEIKQGTVGDIIVYSKYTVNDYIIYVDGKENIDYTVSFDLNGATGSIPSQTLGDGVVLSYPSAPVRAGYVFGGWFANANCTGTAFDFSAQVKDSVTLYAKWIATENSVIGIGETINVTVNGREYFVYDFVPLVSGNVTIYTTGNVDTFGYLYDSKGNELRRNDSASDNNDNFTIVYNVTAGEKYTVKFRGYGKADKGASVFGINGSTTVLDGGIAVYGGGTVDVTFDDNFTMPVPDEREGYVFRGYADENGTMYTDENGNSIKTWDKDEDTVLYSFWEVDGFTVSFVTNGGTVVDSVTLARGARLDINNFVTTKSGYSFLGWYLSASDAESYNASTMPDHDITLYARWTQYNLKAVKYDTSISYVSEYDTVTADIFGATCFDTDGNMIDITATVSGTQVASNSITVKLTAEGLNNKKKTATIQNVKVYGNPTLNCVDTVEYVNVKDGLTAAWFSASGTDTYNGALTVKFIVTDKYGNETDTIDDLAGETVTIRVYVEDVSGNVTFKDIENVKVYGLPIIDNGTKREMKSTETVSAELFGIIVTDSFGESLMPTVTKYSGTIAAGNTIRVKIYAKDSKGNENTQYIDVKVYGAPIINAQTTTDFKLEDEITVGPLGLTATDSHKGTATVTIELIDGTQAAGATLTYKVTAIDVAGNVSTSTATAKIYGAPTISYMRTGIKVGEDIVGNAASNLLRATAIDSFGKRLGMTFVLANGDYTQTATYVSYEITATDHLGNTTTITTDMLGVYDVVALDSLTYDPYGTSIIKSTSKGEEFSAMAIDSFGNDAIITIENAEGSAIVAGEQQDVVIVATDKAGNRKTSDRISNVKVYATPTVTYSRDYYYLNTDEDITYMFVAHDSFGEEVYVEVTILETSDGVMKVKVEATDDAGNTFSREYDICTSHTLDDNCVCTRCGATAHTLNDNCVCTRCGVFDETMVSESLKTKTYLRHDNNIYFGTYPQTKVTDETLTSALTSLAGTLPTSSNSANWTSYGYYISGSVSNFMWYIDKEYNGEKYRGVYFTSYRPYYCDSSSSTGNTYQDDNGYYISTVYWFKYEPITWRILKESDGKALILADLAIDSQQFDYDGSYSNNYANSTIRAWLNNEFYNTAFTSLQKDLIEITNVDNSVSSTGYSSNQYACSNTNDNVFLLSYKEVTGYLTSSSERQMKSSDYAKSQGCYQSTDSSYKGNCWWWLRSPSYSNSIYARYVYFGGYFDNYYDVDFTIFGVLPALVIRLS